MVYDGVKLPYSAARFDAKGCRLEFFRLEHAPGLWLSENEFRLICRLSTCCAERTIGQLTRLAAQRPRKCRHRKTADALGSLIKLYVDVRQAISAMAQALTNISLTEILTPGTSLLIYAMLRVAPDRDRRSNGNEVHVAWTFANGQRSLAACWTSATSQRLSLTWLADPGLG